MDHQNDNGII